MHGGGRLTKHLLISASDISEKATYHVADVISEYRIVKRYYKYNQETSFKRQKIAIYPQNKQCKSRQSPFQNCSGDILIRYCFSGEEINIKSCKNVRVYESAKDKIKKIKQKKGPSRATYDVEDDLGGLTNITNQSEIPNRSVAFEINTKRAIECRNIDPLQQLVNK